MPKTATVPTSQGDGEGQPEEKVIIPFNDAQKTMLDMGRTVNGRSFAYRTMECIGKGVQSLKGLEAFENLHKLDLSKNYIKDVTPVKGLASLLTLRLANNEIPHIRPLLDPETLSFPQLLHLDLSGNSLTLLPILPYPLLRTANLSKNDINKKEEDYQGHPTLQSFDLSDNKVKNLEGISGFPMLKKLNLAGNELTSLEGLAEVPELQELDLGRNKFVTIESPIWQELTNLHTLDVSDNKIRLLSVLEALRVLVKLRSLNTLGNPIGRPPSAMTPDVMAAAAAEEESSGAGSVVARSPTQGLAPTPAEKRLQVLLCHWRLDEIDGRPVAPEEREQAKQANIDRILQERERKRRAEEEEAAAAAAAEAGDSGC